MTHGDQHNRNRNRFLDLAMIVVFEFIGADTPKGRDLESRWRYPGFRHTFRLFTVVWGAALVAWMIAYGRTDLVRAAD